MIHSIETTGKTTEDALKAALEELGMTRDEVSVEIVTMPKSGFLGSGAVPAKLRVSYDDGRPEPHAPKAPREPRAPRTEKAVRTDKPAPAKAEKPAPVKTGKPVAQPAAAPVTGGSREEQAESFLRGLLERMGVECSVAVTSEENGRIDIRLDGDNMGAVIGRRGETLDAIQHLVNYVVNRGSDKHMHISVDAEGYRSKREDSLVSLAQKMAAKTIKYKRSMALEPMNSYERHVIHTALQDYEGVTTSSIGTEPNRRVVVNYVRPAGESAEGERRNRSRGDRNRPRNSEKNTESRPAPAPAAPAKEPAAEAAPPEYPEGYTPPTKNKPQSREWC